MSEPVHGFSFRPLVWLALVGVSLGLAEFVYCQTASTGALTGVVLDVSGAVVPGVKIQLTKEDGSETRSTTSDKGGRFGLLQLSPGRYQLKAEKADFAPLELRDVQISVAEIHRSELHLGPPNHFENLQVSSDSAMVQTDSSALGRGLNQRAVTGLPLVTRNFTQITGLTPGVISGVYHAGELGTGGTALSQIGKSNDGIFVHGSRSYDNNWLLDGISVSDILSSGSTSGGIPIPNPDAIEEFKVQTGLYDAAFGRAAGANVSVITRAGSNRYHGTLFEFVRNDVLNANDYFFKQTNQPRPNLKQNQFGGVIGGPIQKDRLFFLVSYQGTRQVNGLATGQARIACSANLSEPPLTNDRSATALGKLFGGQPGANGGVAVAPDGSNINPAALALLNFKLADGSFLIPNPQKIDPKRPIASQGFSAFTRPCQFDENQYLTNLDYTPSQKHHLAARFFVAHNDQKVTFPGNGFNTAGNIPGFDNPVNSEFLVLSVADTYQLGTHSLNEARVGFVRTRTSTGAAAPFKWSDIGVTEGEMNGNNQLPSLRITGSISMAPALPRTYTQNSFVYSDVFSTIRGKHTLRFGGSLTRVQAALDFSGFGSYVQFLSWPDLLLGLDAQNNGTGTFSNVFASMDLFGLLNRDFRAWEISAFAQDDCRLGRSLTLNLGLRYERPGQFGDVLGRNSSFDVTKANSNPPLVGSLAGYIVASNYPGTVPEGVVRAGNTFGTYGEGEDTIAPRIGFSWQVLPSRSWLILRGGYGIYYSRPTGQIFSESVTALPFTLLRQSTGLSNAGATFGAPFAQPFPTPLSFPQFVPYSPNGNLGLTSISPNIRAGAVQQFAVNVQAELHQGWLLEVGYVGTRGTHLQRLRSMNQALDASPANPIRGITSNTVANIPLRVPVPGIRPDALRQAESEGESWYNGLEASLTKRLGHGVQFLGSYTFSKTLDTDGADINGTSGGNTLTLGDQNSPRQRWGRASFDRAHRFVFSTVWSLPGQASGVLGTILNNWSLAAIVTIQSGNALTISDTNSTNVFGISEDRAQLSGTCSTSQLVKGGSVQSKLNSYFNVSCFTAPRVIGADGVGTGFGNSATGVVDGPGQGNLDVAFTKTVALRWLSEHGSLEFRAEFYNALNHPQFANPDSNFTSPSFGVISSTAVNPRVGQLALKIGF